MTPPNANVAQNPFDFRSAPDLLEGRFDIIMAHGVFSWMPDDARDAMLELCARLLSPNGVLYLNYNAHPGWTVRGLDEFSSLYMASRLAPAETRDRHDIFLTPGGEEIEITD